MAIFNKCEHGVLFISCSKCIRAGMAKAANVKYPLAESSWDKLFSPAPSEMFRPLCPDHPGATWTSEDKSRRCMQEGCAWTWRDPVERVKRATALLDLAGITYDLPAVAEPPVDILSATRDIARGT